MHEVDSLVPNAIWAAPFHLHPSKNFSLFFFDIHGGSLSGSPSQVPMPFVPILPAWSEDEPRTAEGHRKIGRERAGDSCPSGTLLFIPDGIPSVWAIGLRWVLELQLRSRS